MTPSELKRNIERNRPESMFFSRNNMKYAGDTMRNYGVRSAKILTKEGVTEVWELYRRQPTRHGFTRSVYWDKVTFNVIYALSR